MANDTGRTIAAGILLIVCSIHAYAQSSGHTSLRAVIQTLEKKFGVVFTYADETIRAITLPMPPRQAGLDQSLQYLRQNTGLDIEPINDRYIAISKPRSRGGATYCGMLRSSENGDPVIGASIQSGDSFTYSNEKGYFEIHMSDNATLAIRSLGFHPRQVSATELSGNCPTIILSVNPTTLDEITIADVITHGMERKSDGSITVKNRLLGILPGLPQPDALQTLQYLPGVMSIFESASELNIRGGTNDQNLYLLDGIKVYQTGHFFGLISGFNPHITERVNLIKNGSSAYYGDGPSSTISITTDDRVHSRVNGSAGVNLLYADGSLAIPFSGKVSLQVSARHSLPSSWQTPTYRQYSRRAFTGTDLSPSTQDYLSQNEDFSFYDATVKLLYDVTERDKVRASFFNISNSLEYRETGEVNGVPIEKKSSLDQQSLGSGLTYTRLWSDRVKTMAEVYYSRYTLDAVNQNIAENQELVQDNEVLETGVRLSSLVEIKPNFYLQSGYQFFETGITNADRVDNPEFERRVKEVVRTHALFTEGNLSLNDNRTSLRMGVRANYYDKFSELNIEPRMVLSHTLTDDLTLEVLGEMKSQGSVQVIDAQNDFLGVEKTRWLLSNQRDVPVLNGRQISAGLVFNKNNWLIHTEAYFKQVDRIITSSQGFQNQFQYVRSSGNYTTQGMDVLVNHKSNRSLQWMRYSLAKSDYDFAELIPPSFPNNTDIRHIVNGGFSYRFSTVELSTGANWYTGRPTTQPVPGNEIVAGVINYGEPNSERLRNYFRLDFSARWHFYTGTNLSSHAGISLWNVTNRENILNEYYFINEFSQVEKVRQPGLAFTPNIFLRIDF